MREDPRSGISAAHSMSASFSIVERGGGGGGGAPPAPPRIIVGTKIQRQVKKKPTGKGSEKTRLAPSLDSWDQRLRRLPMGPQPPLIPFLSAGTGRQDCLDCTSVLLMTKTTRPHSTRMGTRRGCAKCGGDRRCGNSVSVRHAKGEEVSSSVGNRQSLDVAAARKRSNNSRHGVLTIICGLREKNKIKPTATWRQSLTMY